MNPTNPDRRPVESTTHTPGPQPFGTWFGRWHRIYTDVPAPVAAVDSGSTPTLPGRGSLTVAA